MKFASTILLGVLTCGLAAAQSSGACDRACLNGFVDQYLDALVKHDPKLVPLTKNVKFTENGQRLDPGDGLWRSMAARGSYRLYVDDISTGEVVFMGTIREEGRMPGQQAADVIGLRLKVVNRQIPEVEMLICRSDSAALNFEKLGSPNHLFTKEV